MDKARWTLATIALVSLCARAAPPKHEMKGPAVHTSSYEAAGVRVLHHEIIVPATVADVWHAFTTTEGLRTWAAPVVEFELKTGGKFHSNYRPDGKVGDSGTIYNTVLSYVPLRILAFKIGLTQAFPEGPRQQDTLFAVAEFESVAKRKTKVTLSMAGWGTGKDWDEIYKFFETHNPSAMVNLRDSFVSGPIDWHRRDVAAKGTH